ncbi:MAG TPA: kelch repeat-containing protein [Chitinophagaceae bacterium]|nr:kelch repeat-containing protein [Chitinophagaceae bacterium]
MDIYDVSSTSWTTALLSEARNFIVAAAAGNKILFAGGLGSAYALSKTVDIYDVVTNTWTTAQLSEERYLLAAGAAGNKILFAGGTGANNATKTVDIYDVASNTWSTTQLSEARFSLAGGGTGDKVLFAGGLANPGISDVVDIYTVSTNTWTTDRLSEPREDIVAASAGDKIFFGGGNIVTMPPGGNGNLYDSTVYKTIDIYTASSNTWYTDQLSQPKKNAVAAGSGNKILFAGGATPDSATYAYGIFTQYYSFPKTVDIFTLH